MTHPVSDRARKAAMDYATEQGMGFLHDGHPLIRAFATFERETPGFAAGVGAAARVAAAHKPGRKRPLNAYDADDRIEIRAEERGESIAAGIIARAIRNLTPAPADDPLLGDLLAIIHRDGGHRQEEVGTEQAWMEAMMTVPFLLEAKGD